MLIDRALFFLERVVVAAGSWLWLRFLRMRWITRGFVIAAVLFFTAWALGRLGLPGPARTVAGWGRFVFALSLTAAIIRHLWMRFTHPSQYPSWY